MSALNSSLYSLFNYGSIHFMAHLHSMDSDIIPNQNTECIGGTKLERFSTYPDDIRKQEPKITCKDMALKFNFYHPHVSLVSMGFLKLTFLQLFRI